jgi:hypothetical protein
VLILTDAKDVLSKEEAGSRRATAKRRKTRRTLASMDAFALVLS